ncbi:MAG: hypothetical protein C5B60_00460 [Chloroflexi bacterium]|nr:MAG: hypothetical protein C5B60_00460 [Chloroflexota bacterium]
MNVSQAITRGYNFFVVAFLGIVGGSLVTQVFFEDEWTHRLDELLILAVAVVAVVWYRAGQNRLHRSSAPLILAGAALLSKVVGMVLEISDTKDVADDFNYFMLLLLFVIVASVAYVGIRRAIGTDTGPYAGMKLQDASTEEDASTTATRRG